MENTCCTTCYNYTYQDLNDLRFDLKVDLGRMNSKKINNLYYGYKCEVGIDSDINRATILLESLNRLCKYAYFGSTCLCQEDVQSIIEKIISITGRPNGFCRELCGEITIDDSNLKEWSLLNPSCVAYESYERYAIEFCGDIGIQVSVESKEACNIAIAVKRDIINCNILLAATAYKQACDLGLTVNRTDDECKIDWKLTVENGLNIDYDEYKAFIESNLSYDIINEVYDKGNVIFQNSLGEVILKTPYAEHLFTDLCVDEEKALQNLKSTTTTDNLLQDFN